MNVSSRRYSSAAVLHVTGRLDQDTCDAFRAELMKEVEAASRAGGGVVLDLSSLEYVSSAGLRCFMLASRQAKQHQMKIFVAALQPMVREIFEISHFNLIFQVFPTVREAVGAVSAESAAAYEKG
ncbi:MAG TPA: STAS domain-containing protein [Usitatibacter sp.]|jgi:anti-anti-sigma factor|nr:STAS domain-containing protein [Usitatibacter sp.]